MFVDIFLNAVRRRVPAPLAQFVPRRRFYGCTDVCSRRDFDRVIESFAAVDAGSGELVFNWSEKQTTPDQLRIEEVFGTVAHPSTSVLHVGIGNSGFASRWHDKVSSIVGITVSPPEKERAASLGIHNYSVHLINKYSPRLGCLPGGFDFIIDNNPNYAACCKFHFFALWDSYLALLKPGGVLLTDLVGLGWVPPGFDLRWVMDDHDLRWVADRFGFDIKATGKNNLVRLLVRKDKD